MSRSITLRNVHAADEPFLYEVYTGTRADELALLDWDDTEKQRFLHMQFTAQRDFYRTQFPTADFKVIVFGELPVGRLYVDRREDEIRIVDIALLPAHRNAGIGGRLLGELLAEAADAGKPIRIHVERFNPALRLYERLGFTPKGDNGVYYLMEWSPDGSRPLPQPSRELPFARGPANEFAGACTFARCPFPRQDRYFTQTQEQFAAPV